ncbi:MAG: hypothetical protein WC147_05665, partial [Syntrophomonas sp.]
GRPGEKGYQSQGLVFAAPGRCNLYQAGGDKGTVLLSPIKETVTGIKIARVTKEPSETAEKFHKCHPEELQATKDLF